MQMLACKECNLLLFEVDSRVIRYERSTIVAKGFYENQGVIEPDYADEHDCYMCPQCSGTDVETGIEDLIVTLEFRKIPVSALVELIKLWENLKCDYTLSKEMQYQVQRGIPLDNPELKAILVEARLQE